MTPVAAYPPAMPLPPIYAGGNGHNKPSTPGLS